DGAGIGHRADALDHLGAARQMPACLLDPDDVARPGVVAVGRADVELAPELAVGRGDVAEAVPLLVQAEDLLRSVAEAADDLGLVGVLAAPLQRREDAVADGRGHRAALVSRILAVRVDLDARDGAVGFFVVAARHGQQMAVAIDAHDFQYSNVSQSFGILECLGAVGGNLAVVAQVAQELLQLDALVALQPVGARDLALAHGCGALLDESQQFVAGRNPAFSHRFRCAAESRSWPSLSAWPPSSSPRSSSWVWFRPNRWPPAAVSCGHAPAWASCRPSRRARRGGTPPVRR